MHSLLRSIITYAMLAISFSTLLTACQSTPTAAPEQETLLQKQIRTLKEQGFVQTDEGWELSFADKLLFDSNQYVLNDKSRAVVNKVSKALLSVGLVKMRIEGHADKSGRDAYNTQLSEQRANAVADAFTQTGIPREGLIVRGIGTQKPIADNSTPEGRAENRRVCIIIATD